ncbi:hypothetical protein JOM56_001883 [Amanita muscaria]
MIDCSSDEETHSQLARGRPPSTNQVSRCLSENLSEETTNHYRQVPKSDIKPCPYPPSPISGVPADVLCSIFELYCQVELPVYFPPCYSPPQLIASQVCSVWRQIMLGNPIFWNRTTVIGIPGLRPTSYDKMVEVLRIWLSRAKDLPCFIGLGLSCHHPLWQLDINKNIVRDLIAPHKCKSLDVIFADYHLHDLLDLPNEKLSCIEVLDLNHVYDEDTRETVSLDFHRLTNLTSFSLDVLGGHPVMVPSAEDQYFQIFSRIPWHQLRHIHLDTLLPVLRCLTILETSSSVLETCSLVVSEDLSIATSPLSQMTPIHCQQLREFKVYIDPKVTRLHAGDSFLLLLRLPKLKSLTLHYHDDVRATDFRTLFRMHSVCTMRLEQLTISGLSCDVDAGALLATMPSLRCLELPKNSMFTVDEIRELGAGSIGPFLK